VTPKPTRQCIPTRPYSARVEAIFAPFTLTRPSHQVRRFWPFGTNLLFLLAFAFQAFGRTIGNANRLTPLPFRSGLVLAD
jgi:hypothetical protein